MIFMTFLTLFWLLWFKSHLSQSFPPCHFITRLSLPYERKFNFRMSKLYSNKEPKINFILILINKIKSKLTKENKQVERVCIPIMGRYKDIVQSFFKSKNKINFYSIWQINNKNKNKNNNCQIKNRIKKQYHTLLSQKKHTRKKRKQINRISRINVFSFWANLKSHIFIVSCLFIDIIDNTRHRVVVRSMEDLNNPYDKL
jgi:hypothetical protein